MLPDDLVRSVVGAWGRHAGAIERPTAGTMNDVVIVAAVAEPS